MRKEPGNLYTQLNIAHCYLDLGNTKEALNNYFKVELEYGENPKIQRPIAWCLLMDKQFERAQKYFAKVIEKEGNQNDYLNLGHSHWCLGNAKQAIDSYKKAYEKSGNNKEWFSRAFAQRQHTGACALITFPPN
ncbi:MAG: tetratricopeptide repeat protein [Bacteroidales bacterium]|nr:tetratricopeptide repeat protein [Bacteroidales bacterium]